MDIRIHGPGAPTSRSLLVHVPLAEFQNEHGDMFYFFLSDNDSLILLLRSQHVLIKKCTSNYQQQDKQ